MPLLIGPLRSEGLVFRSVVAVAVFVIGPLPNLFDLLVVIVCFANDLAFGIIGFIISIDDVLNINAIGIEIIDSLLLPDIIRRGSGIFFNIGFKRALHIVEGVGTVIKHFSPCVPDSISGIAGYFLERFNPLLIVEIAVILRIHKRKHIIIRRLTEEPRILFIVRAGKLKGIRLTVKRELIFGVRAFRQNIG